MSSFICSRRHFDSITKGIMRLYRKSNFFFPEKMKIIAPELNRQHPEKSVITRIEKLVTTLMHLQIACVCYQYRDSQSTVEKDIFQQQQLMQAKSQNAIELRVIPLYKATQCALYQIEPQYLEEHRPLTIPEKQTLAFFESLETTLADHISRQHPEYQTAEWSIQE